MRIDRQLGASLAFAMMVVYSAPAHAYVDPVTGGVLAQILAPVLLAVVAFWHRLKAAATSFLGKIRARLRR
jgi:hypothetical protein